MRACLLAASAALLLATTGCHGINLARGHGDPCQYGGGHGHGGHGHMGHNHMGHGGHAAQAPCPPGMDGYAGQGHGGPGYGPGGPGHGGGYGPGGHGYGPGGGAGYGHIPTRGTPGFPPVGYHHRDREYTGPQGPATAQVGYPYYTTRGPRDFLLDNPPTIGR